MNKLRYIFYVILLAALQACNDTVDITDTDGGIKAGDEVAFSARVPQVDSRSAQDDYYDLVNRFEHVQDDYVFNIDMFEEGKTEKIASAIYNPTKNTVADVTTYDEYGTLSEGTAAGMYWPTNVNRYAFHAASYNSSTNVESDQTTYANYFRQDLIEGYGYVPGWDATLNDNTGGPIRNIDGLNYLTTKEWYAANKAWGAPAELTESELQEYWKKIPLYMRHKRSRITVLLKAGEGVEREQIKYDPTINSENISMEVYSYDASNNPTVVTPLLGSYNCEYRSPDAAPEEDMLTACYDAIVAPHNYAEGNNMTEQNILTINLSGMKFSFCAANDNTYSSAPGEENEDIKARYNLEEGKHLILTVTLSTDTRKILITAYVVDWEDWPFSSICDDFGQAADPLPINTQEELYNFLTDPEKNKPGNVGVIIPLNFDLNGWNPDGLELKATLKLAGAYVNTNQRLVDRITASGSIVNGTVSIRDDGNDNTLECAITKENYGTVERINVLAGNTSRKASRAGLVITNYGTIYACTSQMPVYNAGGSSEVFIGGIAAEMLHPMKDDGNGNMTADLSVMPTIDQCNANARVDGGSNVKGGGIAGRAEGKLTNNTYEYGITLLQDVERFKNILYAKGTEELTCEFNEWSTKVDNNVVGGTSLNNARPESDRYNQVIDSQAELQALIERSTYNNRACRARIADSFTVDGDSWGLGIQNLATNDSRNLYCELDCNDKTITLTGSTRAKMLFSNIESNLHDLTLVLDKPIVAVPDVDADADEDKLPARAPLAYAVVTDQGVLRNVKVKMGTDAYIESAASGGLVVWAYDGARIEDCQSNADVRVCLPANTGDQQTYFVGGLVNSAGKATIVRCTYQRDYLNSSEEAYATPTSNIYYGGIVGGTNTKGTHAPELNISDCTSWLTWSASDALPHAAWGGIIGYTKYQSTLSSELVSSMDGNCQGNWWAAPVGASAQGMASGMNQEMVIGKKNSIDPIRDSSY